MVDNNRKRPEPGPVKKENDSTRKQFVHKTFEERLAEYNGEISICDFGWGE